MFYYIHTLIMFKHVNFGKHIELELALELESVTIRRSKKVTNHFQRLQTGFQVAPSLVDNITKTAL